MCAVWEEWGDWSVCNTEKTCGQGIMIRNRMCSNNGKVGMDRMCMGSTNQTQPCQQPNCFGKWESQLNMTTKTNNISDFVH